MSANANAAIQSDVLILDVSDDDKLAEYVSRLSPGGEPGKFVIIGKLRETVNKKATFTVDKVTCGHASDEEKDEGEEETAEGETEYEGKKSKDKMDEPAVMEWAKQEA